MSDDPNLNQGREFIKIEDLIINNTIPKIGLVQQTTDPKLSSIIEAMSQSNNANNPNTDVNDDKFSELEEEFSKKLEKFNKIYNNLVEEILKNEGKDKNLGKYYGKIVKTDDNNYVYVNNFGYTHKFLQNNLNNIKNFNNKFPTCPSPSSAVLLPSSLKISDFNEGVDLSSLGNICNLAGNIIKNDDNNELAWVDEKGVKHVYSSKNIVNEYCKTLNIISVDSFLYNNIVTGEPMLDTTDCNPFNNIDPSVFIELNNLNSEMQTIQQEMENQTLNLEVQDLALQNQINEYNEEIQKNIEDVNAKNEEVSKAYSNYNSNYALMNSQGLKLKSNNYHYITWFLLLVFLIILLIQIFVFPDLNRISLGIIVFFLLIMLYFFLSMIHTKFMWNR